MKKTKIVATISDKRCEVEFLEKLYRAGMNVVRLNTAHQDMEQALKVVENVRKVSDNIAILIDTKGPEVRTMLMDEPMHVDRGETVYLTGDPELKMDGKLIHVSYPYFAEDIKVGDKVLVDDGDEQESVWVYHVGKKSLLDGYFHRGKDREPLYAVPGGHGECSF